MGSSINITGNNVCVSTRSAYQVDVEVDDVDVGEVLGCFSDSEVLDYYDSKVLLEHIDTEEVLDKVGMEGVLNYFGIETILENIPDEDIKAYFWDAIEDMMQSSGMKRK